jgi:hypothetical protein
MPVTVSARSLARDSLAREILWQMGLSINGTEKVTSSVVYSRINAGIAEVCTHAPAYQKLDTVAFSSGTIVADLNSDFTGFIWAFKLLGDTGYVPLRVVRFDSIYSAQGGLAGSIMGVGDEDAPDYFWSVEKQMMVSPRLRRLPGVVDTILVLYAALAPALTSADQEAAINQKYRQALVDWCCWKLEEMRGGWEAAKIFRDDYLVQMGMEKLSGGGQ